MLTIKKHTIHNMLLARKGFLFKKTTAKAKASHNTVYDVYSESKPNRSVLWPSHSEIFASKEVKWAIRMIQSNQAKTIPQLQNLISLTKISFCASDLRKRIKKEVWEPTKSKKD